MNAMTYKGYAAKIEYSDEDECFIGHIIGIQDIVGFHGDSVQALKNAFVEAVDDYLETCRLVKKLPQQPLSGHLDLDIPLEIHAAIASAAQAQGKSINQWVAEALYREVSI
jgi:predicted HicB family RNase H-like nuclease